MKNYISFLILILLWVNLYIMIDEHNKEIENSNKYIKDHNCKVISIEEAHHIGMMIQGDITTYKCDNEFIFRF